ncbi:hypothetical protein [Mycoplasma anserisalpingitidis]|uniref:Lmp protein n=1 Tax=Mycoplasma anserisalpingitidis TaxID=519450 RepID=A0A5B8K2Z6_9MOLU|nr:hypothetical protein [Mycoplasma anserisalpingitidis]QDY88108.1 hypothetical protein FOY43_00290 [Mycoplasma anserisalpingitidis]
MKKKNKKLLISLIALGCVGVITLSASLAACSIIQKNTNSEYKEKITKLLSEIKDEIKILEGDQRKEVNDFFDYINQVESSLNENTNKKDDYNELLNRYTTFAKEIYNQEKIKLSKLINEIKNILKTEFSDEKYSSIHQSLSKFVVDKSVLLDQESNSTYIDLILAQKDLLKALEEANKNKEATDNNLRDELKAKQDKFKEKLSEAKNNNIDIYENNNDDELKTILKPLEDFINELLGKIESLDSQEIDKNNNELDKLLENTLEKIREYNEEKNKAIQKYLELLEQANELKELFDNKNASEFINELNNFMSNMPDSEEIKIFSVSKIETKSEELSSFLEDILARFNQVVSKQDELKKYYDSVIDNELNKYDNYPTIKNDLEEKLNGVIKDYDKVFDNNELDSKFNEINNALNKAEQEKNKQNENTSDESDEVDYKKILLEKINHAKEHELKMLEKTNEEAIYRILKPFEEYVNGIEIQINDLNGEELKNKNIEFDLALEKVRNYLDEFSKYKERVVKEYIEAANNFKKFVEDFEKTKYENIKAGLREEASYIVDEETAKTISTYYLNLMISQFTNSINHANERVKEIENKQLELKNKYDSAVIEIANYDNYPEIKSELESVLNSAIDNYEEIIIITELNERINKIESALNKAKKDKEAEDKKKYREEQIKKIKDLVELIKEHMTHRNEYNDPKWEELFSDLQIYLDEVDGKEETFDDNQLYYYYNDKVILYVNDCIEGRERYKTELESAIEWNLGRLEWFIEIYDRYNKFEGTIEWTNLAAKYKNYIDSSLTRQDLEKLPIARIQAITDEIDSLRIELLRLREEINKYREQVKIAMKTETITNIIVFANNIYREVQKTIDDITQGWQKEIDTKKLEKMKSDLDAAWPGILESAKNEVIKEAQDSINSWKNTLPSDWSDSKYDQVRNEFDVIVNELQSYIESDKQFNEIGIKSIELNSIFSQNILPKIQEISGQ